MQNGNLKYNNHAQVVKDPFFMKIFRPIYGPPKDHQEWATKGR